LLHLTVPCITAPTFYDFDTTQDNALTSITNVLHTTTETKSVIILEMAQDT